LATNTPAKRPNIIRLTVEAALETPVVFHGAVTIIDFTLQVFTNQTNLYISFDEGGTFSPDNFFTLKAGNVWYQQDINWTPPEDAMWLRSAGDVIIVEIIYWS